MDGSREAGQRGREEGFARLRPLAEVVARHTDLPEITTEVRYGSPVDELASFSETVSVLVIEADVRFPTYSVGSVARGLMTYAGCPVILVK